MRYRNVSERCVAELPAELRKILPVISGIFTCKNIHMRVSQEIFFAPSLLSVKIAVVKVLLHFDTNSTVFCTQLSRFFLYFRCSPHQLVYSQL